MKLFNNNNIKKNPKQTKNKTKQNNYSILFILTSKGFSDPIKKKNVELIPIVKSRVWFRFLNKSFQYKWSTNNGVMHEADCTFLYFPYFLVLATEVIHGLKEKILSKG